MKWLSSHTIFFALSLFFAATVMSPALTRDAAGEDDASMEMLRCRFYDGELIEASIPYLKATNITVEDVAVITPADIQRIVAHNLTDYLNRIPGVFFDMGGYFFGNSPLFGIQGDDSGSDLILIDNVVISNLSAGSGEVCWMPLKIIDRIEIIRSPDFSTSGPALFKVVSIVTKGSDDLDHPRDFIDGSYYKNCARDFRNEISDKRWLDYYIYTGARGSDGLVSERKFHDYNLFLKPSLKLTPLSEDAK